MRRRVPINLSLSLVVFGVACMICNSIYAQDVIHKGYSSSTDKSIECIRRLYSKNIIAAIRDFGFVNCPVSKNDLQTILETNGIRIFETDQWAYLITASNFSPKLNYWARLKWTSIRVEVNPVVRSGHISDAELKQWTEKILQDCRLIPISPPVDPELKGQVVLTINLKYYRVPLVKDGPDTVLTFIDQLSDGFYGRLVYSEVKNDQLRIRGDSPLFDSYGLPVFSDVNADGWKEILFESSTGGNQQYPRLVIFDHDGNEITRQSKCETFGETFDEHGDGTCPIGGALIDFFPDPPQEGVATQILVKDWEGDHLDHVFRLKDGVYVPDEKPRPRHSKK